MKRLLIAAVVLAACTGGDDDAGSTTTIDAPRPPSTTTTTLPPLGAVEVTLSEVEGAAAFGAEVQVGDTVRLTQGNSEVMMVPIGQTVTLEISYVVDDQMVEPSWTQEVEAAEDGSTTLTIEQPWRRTVPAADPIVLGWQAFGTVERYLDELDAAPGLTVTSPRWWSLDEEGFLIGEPDPEFVATAHELGLEVWPYAGNAFDPTRTRRALASPQQRKLLAAQLSGQAQLAGADGVNIDYESFSTVDRDTFVDFVAQLTEFVHGWGGVVSVDITVRTRDFATLPEATYDIFDRRALAEASDYLALMAYDEYTTVRPAGPTASHEWAEQAVYWLMRYVDPHQILLGIPFYSRIWNPEDLNKPKAAGIGTIVELAESNPRTYDPEFDLDRVELEDGRFFWAEDYDSLATRMELARESGVAGVAAWRLGLDSPEVWPIVAP
ncbi:MAG: glycosyl hydrolase family 18 protein [Acidimicrobiia bacterium]